MTLGFTTWTIWLSSDNSATPPKEKKKLVHHPWKQIWGTFERTQMLVYRVIFTAGT
jgi:hypothetical protein